MDVMQILQRQIDDQVVHQLTNQIGAQSTEQTETAIQGVLSTLVAALSRNTANPEGAQALTGALSNTHDGSILEDVAGFLSGQRRAANPSMMNGAGILQHVLGGRQSQVEQSVGRATGLNAGQIAQLMMKLAPVVLGVLGQMQRKQQLSSEGVGQVLNTTVQAQRQQNPDMGFIEKMLDADGDGSVMDDIAGFGLKALFGRK